MIGILLVVVLPRVLSTLRLKQEEFDEDRNLRLDREAVIVKQLTDHEQEVNERFESQIVSASYIKAEILHSLNFCEFWNNYNHDFYVYFIFRMPARRDIRQ